MSNHHSGQQEQFYPSDPNSDIAPLPTALGVNPQYVARRPEIIEMREDWSWAGDKFRIHTVDGTPILQMKSQVFSMSNRKEFLLPNDQLLYTLRRRLFSIPKSFYLEDDKGNEFANIEGGWSMGTKFSVNFLNVLGPNPAQPEQVTLDVRGDWIDRKADISWRGMTVARVRRQFRNWREVSGRHTYGVEVAPGTDMTLIAAIVVAIDEDHRNNN